MKSCFGYVRVSSKKQGEGASIAAQKAAILRYAAGNDIEIADWFEEHVTAAKRGRPEFNRMMRDLQRGQADGFVVHKIDRSSRNFFDWARICAAGDSGIKVYAACGADFDTTGGRLQADIEFVVGAHYIRNLKGEIRKGQRGLMSEFGLYPFSAPIGYCNNGKGELKTPDPKRADLVRSAFKLYATGEYSIRSLREELTKRGLRNVRGNQISKGCLEKMLANPFYTGTIQIRRTGEVYKGKHKPLISAELFETVQAVKDGKYHKKVTRHRHTYRGLFQCGHCGKSMIPEKQKGHVYYRCQDPICPTNCVREEHLEDAIDSVLSRTSLSEPQYAALKQSFKAWWDERRRADKSKGLRLTLAQLDAKMERLTDAVIDGLIDKEAFNQRKQSVLLQTAKVQEQLQQARKQSLSMEGLERFLEHVKNLAGHYQSALPDEKREIAKITTSNRSVRDKKHLLSQQNGSRQSNNH